LNQRILYLSLCIEHQGGTEYFTLQAVKQDIIRSLASRLELHWDSLVEEEQGSPEGMLLHAHNSKLHQYIPKTQGV
jgi:hypothetical protein